MTDCRRIVTALIRGAARHGTVAVSGGSMIDPPFSALTRSWDAVPRPRPPGGGGPGGPGAASPAALHGFVGASAANAGARCFGRAVRRRGPCPGRLEPDRPAPLSPDPVGDRDRASRVRGRSSDVHRPSIRPRLPVVGSCGANGPRLRSARSGRVAMLRDRMRELPDMPTHGLCRVICHPIHQGLARKRWAMPPWTIDQLGLAVGRTAYRTTT